MGASCTYQDADSGPRHNQKEQWREMLQENPQILLQLEYQKMQLSLLQEIREERLHYEDLLNRRLMQEKQFRRNDDLNDGFERNDAFHEVATSRSFLPSHSTTRYGGMSSVDDSYLEELSAFTSQEDAKMSMAGPIPSHRRRRTRSYSAGSAQKKIQKRTFNSQRRETLDMTNCGLTPGSKRDPATIGGNLAIEQGFGNMKPNRVSKESPSRPTNGRNSNSDSGSSSKQNDSYPEFEENWKPSPPKSQSKVITIDTFGGVKQTTQRSRTTSSLYEKQQYAAKIQNLYQKDENWKLLEAAFTKDDYDAQSETTISTLASEHAKKERVVDSPMLSVGADGSSKETGVRKSYTPSLSPKGSIILPDPTTHNPTNSPQTKPRDDLPPASDSESEQSVVSDSFNISVLSGEWDRLLSIGSASSLQRVYTKEDERRLCKRRPSIPCEP